MYILHLTFVAAFLNHLASSCQEAGIQRTHCISLSRIPHFLLSNCLSVSSFMPLMIVEITSIASISFPCTSLTFVDLESGRYNKQRHIHTTPTHARARTSTHTHTHTQGICKLGIPGPMSRPFVVFKRH